MNGATCEVMETSTHQNQHSSEGKYLEAKCLMNGDPVKELCECGTTGILHINDAYQAIQKVT